MDRCCLSWLGTRVPLGGRNARLGLAPSASSYPAEWNVPAVPRPYPLLLDEGAVPGLAASRAHGTEGWARGEEGTWGGRASNRRRWALGWRSEDPGAAPSSRGAAQQSGPPRPPQRVRGAGSGQRRGGCARAAEPSRAEPSERAAWPPPPATCHRRHKELPEPRRPELQGLCGTGGSELRIRGKGPD